jgi:hypothetical protein
MHTAFCQLHEQNKQKRLQLTALPCGRSQAAALSSYAVVLINLQAQLVRAPLQADFVPLQHMVRVQARKQTTLSQAASSQASLDDTPDTVTQVSAIYLVLGKAAHCCQQLLGCTLNPLANSSSASLPYFLPSPQSPVSELVSAALVAGLARTPNPARTARWAAQ